MLVLVEREGGDTKRWIKIFISIFRFKVEVVNRGVWKCWIEELGNSEYRSWEAANIGVGKQ